MTELRFRTDLYAPDAVSETVEAFEPFVQIERESREGVEILKFSVDDPTEEAELAGEIANYVLGVTVDGPSSKGEES